LDYPGGFHLPDLEEGATGRIVTTDLRISNRTFFTALSLMALTLAVSLLISSRGMPRVVDTNLEELPMEINGLHGIDDSFPEAVFRELNADKNLYRHYRSPDDRELDLYIGYYGTAKGGRTGHNPFGCLPGQGWGVVESGEIMIKSHVYPDGVPVNYLLSTKGDSCLTTIYWYQTAGTKVVSNGVRQNIQRFMGMIFRNRNDGAFVRITMLSDRDNAGKAKEFASSFSQRVFSLLPGYWPVER
jgi:EpsI family protein